MIISAPVGTKPIAFTQVPVATADAASALAANFGAATPERIQAIETALQKLLADEAQRQQSEGVGHGSAASTNTDAAKLRKPDMGLIVRAAMQRAVSGSAPQVPMTPEAAMTLLAMQLSELITTENSRSLALQLELVKQRLGERAASAAELSEAIRLAQALVESAMGDVGTAEGELAAAVEALKQAEAEAARLEQALADAPAEEQDAIRAQLEAAKGKVMEQQARVGAATQVLAEAVAVLDQAMADLEQFKSEADRLDPNGSVSARGDEKARTNAAMLGELLAVLQEIIGKANDAKLEADTKLIQEVLKLREAENMRRSQEYQEELAKAEAAQKKMGCLGKIIGWVVTVVAVVAAPFTGGASMALAGIGLALAIGSELGFDLMGKIMEPIMKLVMELVKAVGNLIGDVLTSLGVSSAFVDKIKDVLGVIAVAAMIIAAVVLTRKVAGTAAVQQLAKAVTRAVSEAISKALPQMIKAAARTISSTVDDVAKAISKTAAKVTNSSADTLASRAGTAIKASHGLQFANQTSQGVGAVIIAEMYVDAAKLLAQLEVGLADTKIFRDLIQKILEYFMQTNNLVADLFQQMTNAQESEYETAQFVTARVGSVNA
jgi:invasin B